MLNRHMAGESVAQVDIPVAVFPSDTGTLWAKVEVLAQLELVDARLDIWKARACETADPAAVVDFAEHCHSGNLSQSRISFLVRKRLRPCWIDVEAERVQVSRNICAATWPASDTL